MIVSLHTSALRATGRLEAVKASIPAAIDAGMDAVAAEGKALTTAAMDQLIYDQPVPESMVRRGQPRTGALRASETIISNLLQPHQRAIVTRNPLGPYAQKQPILYAIRRHNSMLPAAPWRAVGAEELRPKAPGIFERAAAAFLAQARGVG